MKGIGESRNGGFLRPNGHIPRRLPQRPPPRSTLYTDMEQVLDEPSEELYEDCGQVIALWFRHQPWTQEEARLASKIMRDLALLHPSSTL